MAFMQRVSWLGGELADLGGPELGCRFSPGVGGARLFRSWIV